MVGEAEDWILETSDDVDIRRFRRQRHRGRSQRRLPVEPGTGEAGSGKKVSKRFQFAGVPIRILFDAVATSEASSEHPTANRCQAEQGLNHQGHEGTRSKTLFLNSFVHLRVLGGYLLSAGTSNASASGTILIAAGSVPSSSPSASTKMRESAAASPSSWQSIFRLCTRSIPPTRHRAPTSPRMMYCK